MAAGGACVFLVGCVIGAQVMDIVYLTPPAKNGSENARQKHTFEQLRKSFSYIGGGHRFARALVLPKPPPLDWPPLDQRRGRRSMSAIGLSNILEPTFARPPEPCYRIDITLVPRFLRQHTSTHDATHTGSHGSDARGFGSPDAGRSHGAGGGSRDAGWSEEKREFAYTEALIGLGLSAAVGWRVGNPSRSRQPRWLFEGLRPTQGWPMEGRGFGSAARFPSISEFFDDAKKASGTVDRFTHAADVVKLIILDLGSEPVPKDYITQAIVAHGAKIGRRRPVDEKRPRPQFQGEFDELDLCNFYRSPSIVQARRLLAPAGVDVLVTNDSAQDLVSTLTHIFLPQRPTRPYGMMPSFKTMPPLPIRPNIRT